MLLNCVTLIATRKKIIPRFLIPGIPPATPSPHPRSQIERQGPGASRPLGQHIWGYNLCKVTTVILHGIVSPRSDLTRGYIPKEPEMPPSALQPLHAEVLDFRSSLFKEKQ